MIVPIADVLKAAKPLFCGLDRPLAAPGGADDDRPLTPSHNGIEPSSANFSSTDLTNRYVVVGLDHCRGVALPGR
jgi:hypothetical protein